jgi:putative DNA primase/helicase
LLTSDTIKYEQKGVDAFTIRNYARWIFSTNNNTPVKVELGDRRFAIFECSNEKCKTETNDDLYFKRLSNAMKQKSLQKSFFDHLNSFDITNFDLIKNRPITEFYKEVQESSIPIVAKFLNDVILTDITVTKYKSRDMYMQYKSYCTDYGYTSATETGFGRDIQRYAGILRKRSNGTIYEINPEELKNSLRKSGLTVDDDVEFVDSASGYGI